MCQLSSGNWQQLCPGTDGSILELEPWCAQRCSGETGAFTKQELGEGGSQELEVLGTGGCEQKEVGKK